MDIVEHFLSYELTFSTFFFVLRFVRNFCACYNWVFMGNLIYSAANLTLIFFAIGSVSKRSEFFIIFFINLRYTYTYFLFLHL